MKFYSEKTKKFYETEKECVKAEDLFDKELKEKEDAEAKKMERRKTRADEVKKARDEALAAQKKYSGLLSKFCKDYGAFHMTLKEPEELSDLVNLFLNWL